MNLILIIFQKSRHCFYNAFQTPEDNEEPENPDSAKSDFKPIPRNGTCGFATRTGFIVGGKDTVRGEFPFLAALGRFKDSNECFEDIFGLE